MIPDDFAPDIMVATLQRLGYTAARFQTYTRRCDGAKIDQISINANDQTDAVFIYAGDDGRLGLRVFGRFVQGYARPLRNPDGTVKRVRRAVNGKMSVDIERGEPLTADEIKSLNARVAISTRQEITGAALAAFLAATRTRPDIAALDRLFRLTKYVRKGKRGQEIEDEAERIDPDGDNEAFHALHEAAADFMRARPSNIPPGTDADDLYKTY